MVEIRIKESKNKDTSKSVIIAQELKEWFTQEAIQNMKIDFLLNNVVTAIYKKKIVGFLCYNSRNGKVIILWMGIKRKYQHRGIGKLLLEWLVDKTKRLKGNSTQVETLTDKDPYIPYQITRNFYYKYGFKKIKYIPAQTKGWDDQILLEKILK